MGNKYIILPKKEYLKANSYFLKKFELVALAERVGFVPTVPTLIGTIA